MNSWLFNIKSVAKYERKLLMRSWFFRIFFILAIVILGLLNILFLLADNTSSPWIMRAIPANIPYFILLLLNTGQAVVAVFLSSEFLKSDKKLDTSEVFYVHSLSNAEYVFGKIWGNISVFLRLNLIVMAMVAIFNIASEVEFDWMSYIIYFFIICIPTLIYIFGLSVSLMLILKNQAITFVLLLGYIGLTVFYIEDKFYYLFDYMVYSLPIFKSTIIGFTNLQEILNHRGIYMLLGIALIFLAVFMFRRLPNTPRFKYVWLTVSICLFIAGGAAAFHHVNNILQNDRNRKAYTKINNEYVHTPKMKIDKYDISVEQHPASVSIIAKMQGTAEKTSSHFTFCLNPALVVKSVKYGDKEIPFERTRQILVVDLGNEIARGDSASLAITYEGRIDGGFCYLDVLPEDLEKSFVVGDLFRVDKQYYFQTSNFLLFSPESYWYPRPGTSYSDESPDWQQSYFSTFHIEVKTLPGLKALSQGSMQGWTETKLGIDSLKNNNSNNSVGDSLFCFDTDFPSPSATLVIGDYERKSIDVDSTVFSIYYIRGHDFFISPFDSIIDTIPYFIRNFVQNMENTYKLDYSFNRFSLIEVPAQFYGYTRTWTNAQECMQPEMVLFPEKGCLFQEGDIVGNKNQQKNWAKNNGQEINDKEASIRTLNAIIWIMGRKESNFNWSENRGAVNVSTQYNPYFIFPQLYNFRYNIFSSEWPIANKLIELYLQNNVDDNNRWIRETNGISNNEKANILMEQRDLKSLLSDIEIRNILDNVISLKAAFIFAPAEEKIGWKEFRDSLRLELNRNIFKNIELETLLDTLGSLAKINLRETMGQWNSPTKLPAYIVGTPETKLVINKGEETYVLKFQVTNDSDNDGIIHIMIRPFMDNDDPKGSRMVTILAHETKQFVSLWEEAPRQIEINTLVSSNLPEIISQSSGNIERVRQSRIEEEGDFLINNASYTAEGETIVDNEDSTLFELSAPDIVGMLPKWLDRVEETPFKYSGISWWRAPLQWTLTTNDRYYGTHIRSAYVIKSGNGSQTATWHVPVPAPGRYDLYYFYCKPGEMRQRGRRRDNNNSEYHFKVQYDGDEEEAYFDLRHNDDGWVQLGTYSFNDDTIHVVMSNQCNIGMVTADAVKIVKK